MGQKASPATDLGAKLDQKASLCTGFGAKTRQLLRRKIPSGSQRPWSPAPQNPDISGPFPRRPGHPGPFRHWAFCRNHRVSCAPIVHEAVRHRAWAGRADCPLGPGAASSVWVSSANPRHFALVQTFNPMVDGEGARPDESGSSPHLGSGRALAITGGESGNDIMKSAGKRA